MAGTRAGKVVAWSRGDVKAIISGELQTFSGYITSNVGVFIHNYGARRAWAAAHQPSGLRLFTWAPTRKQAMACVEEVLKISSPRFLTRLANGNDKKMPPGSPTVKRIVRKIRSMGC